MAEYSPSRLVRSFERHLRAENRSERTVENDLESLHQAEVFLQSRGRRLEDATKADLEDFLADLLARRSASTAASRYKALRILYRWLEEEEDVPSLMAKMKPPIIPEQPVPVIPDDGLRRLLKVCEGKSLEARRDMVLIMLLLDTGARRGELVGLRLADIDLDLDVLLVPGKGRRERAWSPRAFHGVGLGTDARAPRPGGRVAWLASAPVSSHLRPPVARGGRRRDGPAATGRLEVSSDAPALWSLGGRRPRT
jgi:integrase/recombinase XerC